MLTTDHALPTPYYENGQLGWLTSQKLLLFGESRDYSNIYLNVCVLVCKYYPHKFNFG